MFISKKELEDIRKQLKAQDKEIKSLKQAVSALKQTNKEQNDTIKEIKTKSEKKYISELFDGKDEAEAHSIMDEWLNGAKEDSK